jgi:hypothetical protein
MVGGFVGFPGGKFTADPDGVFTRDQSTGTFRWLSNKRPQIVGSVSSLFYDRAMSRWLPSSRAAVYPDGTRYAYVSGGPNQTVHIVEVATGIERVFPAPHPIGAVVFAYSKDGVYLASIGGAGESGLWLLDPQMGSERLVTNEKIVVAVGNGKAWLSEITSSQIGSFADALIELDLASGSKTVWAHRNNPNVTFIGLTSDSLPVVSLTGEGVSLLHSPGVGERIYSGTHWLDSVSSDTHGIWFQSYDGIYFYSSGSGFHRVSAAIGAPAGTCV